MTLSIVVHAIRPVTSDRFRHRAAETPNTSQCAPAEARVLVVA